MNDDNDPRVDQSDEDPNNIDPERFHEENVELAGAIKRIFKEIRLPSDNVKVKKDQIEDGWIIDDFRIIRRLGSGGMAQVFEAEQISIKRRVALKTLPKHLRLSAKAVKRFQREAEAGGRQNHPGIATIYEIGEFEGGLYIAQELVTGGQTIAENLDDFRKIDRLPRGYFRETAKMITSIGQALSHAHSNGVIHRDIKPSNIILTKEGLPKIVDFGFAFMEDSLIISQTGEWSGTPFYMSPEQAEGRRENIDVRTDIYSLGVTLYECLTLTRPFEGDTSQELIKKIALKQPINPLKISPRLPKDLATICLKAIEKDPKSRYPRMKDFTDDLCRFVDGESITARPAGIFRKSVRWITCNKLISFSAAAIFSALLTFAILLNVLSKQRENEKSIFRNQYLTTGRALALDELTIPESVWKWCMEYDPHELCGPLVAALISIEKDSLTEAASQLHEAIDRSVLKNETFIEQEARYLLGIVKYRLAKNSNKIVEKQRLEEEAAKDLKGAGEPSISESLVWRYSDFPFSIPDNQEWTLMPIKLNRDHYIVQTHIGLSLFTILYEGGKKVDFDLAISCLEKRLAKTPNDPPILTILARTQFFYARHYNQFSILKTAISLLNKAIQVKGTKPYFMTHTTLGQIHLLMGENDQAMACFKNALAEAGEQVVHVQNIYRGIGEVHMRQGRYKEAQQQFEAALKLVNNDTHVLTALAELLFINNEYDEALRYATSAMERIFGGFIRINKDSSPYITSARILFKLERYNEAVDQIYKIHQFSDLTGSISPRDCSIACLLLTTLPDDLSEIRAKSDKMATTLSAQAYLISGLSPSPICLSAMGMDRNNNGLYEDAIKYLIQANKIRSGWPPTVKEFYWSEFARDYFFLALVYSRLADKKEGAEKEEMKRNSELYFKKGEALYIENSDRYSVNKDIMERARLIATSIQIK